MHQTRQLVFFADPGHGWLRVSMADLRALGIAGKITEYSYRNGDQAYLEEDLDAGTFLDAAQAAGWEINHVYLHQDETPIRGYRRYYL